MGIQTDRPVDVRDVAPTLTVRGGAAYVSFDTPDGLPPMRITSVRDALALANVFILTAQALRGVEVAARSAHREGYGDGLR